MQTENFSKTRRSLIQLIALGLAAPQAVLAEQLETTPAQTSGPFYPVQLPLDDDADLTFVNNRKTRAKGELTELTGRLLDSSGKPVKNTRFEIWQCDARGFYHHPEDRGGQADLNFQGHGQVFTDSQGRYRFRTIKPVAYPGRTPHIHVAVFPQGAEVFSTQIYVAGEAQNQSDFLYLSVPAEKRKLLEAEFKPGQVQDIAWQASFDLVLQKV